MGLCAQTATMTLTFTAENNGQHVPMNSILIENLSQGGDTTLYEPDTVLVLDYITGINHPYSIDGKKLMLSQNFPNPMHGKSEVNLSLPNSGSVLMLVSDIMGRELVRKEFQLEKGVHTFLCYPGRESIYFLTVKAGGQIQSLKMFNTPARSGSTKRFQMVYNGPNSLSVNNRAKSSRDIFLFLPGDELRYTAVSSFGEEEITDAPQNDKTYTFQFGGGGVPCPGMETITDFDANVYNTVLIGDQCWMAENLRTTTYKNGTPIPNVEDGSAWSGLDSGAFVWYENDVTWKESYGALYNWFATVDPNGLCPEGWHVPTNADWTALTDYIGGTFYPHSAELKSCRQVDSPLGGACNTSEHPRWSANINNYGTDEYGLSILPGGIRFNYGFFSDLGNYGYYWSGTEYNGYYAWYRSWYYGHGTIEANYYAKSSGFSVRCLKDL